jgi:hypothetical protein
LVGNLGPELVLFQTNCKPHAPQKSWEGDMPANGNGIVFSALVLTATLIAPPLAAAPVQPGAQHDGAHDFDFLIGDWRAHVRRLPDRLNGSHTWVTYDGEDHHHKVLTSNANLEEFVVENPQLHLHMHAQTLRLFNPSTQQWSIYPLDVFEGTLDVPPVVGHFTGRRGEFFHQENFKGRVILVRYVWLDLSPKSARMEQSFSDDGGKSWEVNWICELSR